MRALVTGGAGFIGSHIADALLERGDEVHVIDNLTTGKEENLAGAQLHRVDIRETARVNEVIDLVKPEVVFHLAAQADVRKSLEDPAFDATTNVVGTINVLEASRRAGARRFVNTSTGGAIYGVADQIPTPETAATEPIAAYGQSKMCAEQYLGWARRLYGFSAMTLRYGNVYGPRQDPHGDAGVIAIFLGKALAGEQPTVFGDGLQTRDYVFVGDIVRANLAAADHPDPSPVYNVGTNEESTVLDVVAAVREAAGLTEEQFSAQLAPARQGELQRSGLDVSLAKAELGYEAQTDLRTGIAETLAWVRETAAH
jgi:UDP-glucose 4-epimerase